MDSTEPGHDTVDIVMLEAGDESVLANVDADVFDNAVDSRLAGAFLNGPDNLLAVAIHEGQVVGMASGLLYLHPDKPLQLFVNEVGVSRRFHRRGIGRRLVSCLLEGARARGCVEAWVATEVGNTAACALYASLGGSEAPDRAVVYTWKL